MPQYSSNFEFAIITVKNGTNIRIACNCNMSFNIHDNTENEAWWGLFFPLYRWRPWGLEILRDAASSMWCSCDVTLWPFNFFGCPEYFFPEPPRSPLPSGFLSYITLLGQASTWSRILTLPLLLLVFFFFFFPIIHTTLVFYIEIK